MSDLVKTLMTIAVSGFLIIMFINFMDKYSSYKDLKDANDAIRTIEQQIGTKLIEKDSDKLYRFEEGILDIESRRFDGKVISPMIEKIEVNKIDKVIMLKGGTKELIANNLYEFHFVIAQKKNDRKIHRVYMKTLEE